MFARGKLAIAFALALTTAAFAQSSTTDLSGTMQAVRGAYPGMVAGSVLTASSVTLTHAANQTICAATGVTLCVPGTIPMSNVNGGRLLANRVTLWKSGSSTTNASFNIWFYGPNPPIVTTPNQFDGTSYTGPRLADAPNYLGNAACATATATSDTSPGVWFECTLSNPNTAGALDLQAAGATSTTSGFTPASPNIYYLISTGAAYTTATSETFTPYMGGLY